ncbi:phosphoenolpyruvate--protein phosphotransferase [Acerihabitans sp.]|uniref:phosphoenolpyruvate--protein phosphotransferase n=1 Tax=Acerihabitans sp. TaxID=2811394 RepID=UPI002ED99450
MQILQGKAVSPGIALGTAWIYHPVQVTVAPEPVANPQQELARFALACADALAQLRVLEDKVRLDTGEENAQLFVAHQLMLQDEDFQQTVRDTIDGQGVNAAWAVNQAGALFAGQLAAMEDAYFQARAADVLDVTARLIAILGGERTEPAEQPAGEAILFAHDLTPSETVQLDRRRIMAIVTLKGSANSHTAILARAMNIPALVGLDTPALPTQWQGQHVIVDSESGRVYLGADSATTRHYRYKLSQRQQERQRLLSVKDQPAITRCGRRVNLYANIGSVADIAAARDNGAEGIGLFRSEFLYLGRQELPGEQEQFAAYRAVAEGMAGQRVIVRTLDLGADKQADYLQLAPEDNPALGCRAIRLCLARPELLITQLRAILRASVYGRVAIMFPMITAVWEVWELKQLYQQCRAQLDNEGIAYRPDIELGIMIETPAAALIGDLLAPEVDFFSIGTNDLTQYTLAVDRQNPALERYDDPVHPALLRLITQVIDQAHRHGIWVGICGELAANPDMSEFFLRLGIDELSVSPAALLPLKKTIQLLDLREK